MEQNHSHGQVLHTKKSQTEIFLKSLADWLKLKLRIVFPYVRTFVSTKDMFGPIQEPDIKLF